MDLSLKLDEKNKNWREKNHYGRTLKDDTTKADTKSKELEAYNTVFSDLTFTAADAPDRVQSNSDSATSAIPEYPTIKGIFAATGAWMQALAVARKSDTDIVTLEIPKSQVHQKWGYSC